jgi:hypothetical protein
VLEPGVDRQQVLLPDSEADADASEGGHHRTGGTC